MFFILHLISSHPRVYIYKNFREALETLEIIFFRKIIRIFLVFWVIILVNFFTLGFGDCTRKILYSLL